MSVFSCDMQMTVIEAVIQPKNGERAKVIKWEAAAQGIAGFRIHKTKDQPASAPISR